MNCIFRHNSISFDFDVWFLFNFFNESDAFNRLINMSIIFIIFFFLLNLSHVYCRHRIYVLLRKSSNNTVTLIFVHLIVFPGFDSNKILFFSWRLQIWKQILVIQFIHGWLLDIRLTCQRLLMGFRFLQYLCLIAINRFYIQIFKKCGITSSFTSLFLLAR